MLFRSVQAGKEGKAKFEREGLHALLGLKEKVYGHESVLQAHRESNAMHERVAGMQMARYEGLQDRQEKMQMLQDLRTVSNNLATEIKTLGSEIGKNPMGDNADKEAQLKFLREQLRTVSTKLSSLGGVTLPEFTPADTLREAAANKLKERNIKFPR